MGQLFGINFRMGSDIAEIARLNDLLADVFGKAGTNDRVAAALKLCVNEAVANVIAHGRTSDVALLLEVDVYATVETAVATVSDNCYPFDPLSHPLATRMTSLSDAKVGGYGILLIRETAREVSWQAIGDHGNILTLLCAVEPNEKLPR
jgi:serine/threonine-protein kinase RsbW